MDTKIDLENFKILQKDIYEKIESFNKKKFINKKELSEELRKNTEKDLEVKNDFSNTRSYINIVGRVLCHNYKKVEQTNDFYLELADFDDLEPNLKDIANFYGHNPIKVVAPEDLMKLNSNELFSPILQLLMSLRSFTPLIAFWEPEKMLGNENFRHIFEILRDKKARKYFKDPFLNFTMDLSGVLVVLASSNVDNMGGFIHGMDRYDPIVTSKPRLRLLQVSEQKPSTAKEIEDVRIYSNIERNYVIVRKDDIKKVEKTASTTPIKDVIIDKTSIGSDFEIIEMVSEDDSFKLDKLIFDLTSPNPSIYQFSLDDFILKDIIPHSSRQIRRYTYAPLDKLVVIKWVTIPTQRPIITKNKSVVEDATVLLNKEVSMLKKVTHHENIVDFYGVARADTYLLVVMESMDMSLKDLYWAYEQDQIFPEKLLGPIAVAVIRALNFCFLEKNIIHRDVKPDNILLNWNGEIKLADFGISRELSQTSFMATTGAGTLIYMPPERLDLNFANNPDQLRYGIKSDVWSLGITLLECMLKGPLFRKADVTILLEIQASYKNFQQNGAKNLIDRIPSCYSVNLQNFLLMCFEEVNRRPDYEELMGAPFYKAHENVDKEYVKKKLEKVKDA